LKEAGFSTILCYLFIIWQKFHIVFIVAVVALALITLSRHHRNKSWLTSSWYLVHLGLYRYYLTNTGWAKK